MVIPLGPGKFYGRGLPRPRYFTDVKFNSERIDPPLSVLDPLLSWAHEAHWSMGGLSFNRLRLQGRIEGNVDKLRKEFEKRERERSPPSKTLSMKKIDGLKRRFDYDSPPPAPKIVKRKRRLVLIEEEEEDETERGEEEEEEAFEDKRKERTTIRRFPVRKLGDDFDRVANDEGVDAAVIKVVEDVSKTKFKGKKLRLVKSRNEETDSVSVNRTRTSARLAKLKLSP